MDLFIPNAMMFMSAQQQMLLHQQMDIQFATMHCKPRALYKPEAIPDRNIVYRGIHDYNYSGNNFNPIPEEIPLFEDREIIDVMHNKIICYIKVDTIDEHSVILKCEIKRGYMYEEDVREIIYTQVMTALKNGFTNIFAVIGQNDEIAGEILEELGFEIKPTEDKQNGV